MVSDYAVTDPGAYCAHLEGWSPDGSKILFRTSTPENVSDLRVKNADGSGEDVILKTAGEDGCFGGPTLFQASFSPNGRKILFKFNPDGQHATGGSGEKGGSDIYVMNADGTGEVQLTDTPGYCELSPRWSPNGRKILYKRCSGEDREGSTDLCVMSANGSSVQVVVPGASAQFFEWSPRGDWIVYEFENTEVNYQRDVYIVRPDGSRNTRLTLSDESCEHTPLWGPDGTILYRSDLLNATISDTSSTWVMSLWSSRVQAKLMVNPFGGKWHDWSPDGNWIAFQAGHWYPHQEQIYMVDNPLQGLNLLYSIRSPLERSVPRSY